MCIQLLAQDSALDSTRTTEDQPECMEPGLLIAVAPRYRYCSGATFTVVVAVASILYAESSGDSSAAIFFSCLLALFATATFKKEN